jgi:hypothetical protein
MNVRQRLQRTRERTRQVWTRSLSRVTSKLRPLNPWSVNPGAAAYVAVVAVTTTCWCLGSIRVWSVVRPYSVLVPVGAAVSSGTVVAVSVGLTAIPLALAIVLGQMYSGRAGRLRVFLQVSGVQLSLVATVTTGIVAAALGGQFLSWVTLLGLGGIAFLSCSPILKVLNLLQHQEQFVEAWKGFVTSRQGIIASQSARRQEAAATAEVTISGWGNDVKIEDRFFERFHGDDLSSYVRVPAGNVGQVDAVDLSSLQRLLDVLRKQAALQASKNSSALMHIESPSSTTLITSSGEPHSPQPLLIICCLPGSTVDDRERGLAFLRTDALLDSDQHRTMARTLRRAFRIDNSERISETITDLQSETVELCDDLKKGIRSNDRQLVEQFRQMSLSIVEAAGTIRGLVVPGTVHDDYIYRVGALARATDDARRLVKDSTPQTDREIRDLVLSLTSSLAYSAAETGSPEVFQNCLWPLKLRYQDALQQHPNPEEIHHGPFWYGVLSSAIQRQAEPNVLVKTGIEPAVSEARLLLQSLSSLLLFFARQHEWTVAASVADEISSLEPRPTPRRNDAAPSGGYPAKFGELVSLTYYGLHACLVDLAMRDPAASVPHDLVEATWSNDDFDLSRLLSVHTQARAESTADGWSWGWEPEPVSGVMFSPRTDEILMRGFVATAITWPERALFQDSDTWRITELEKLERAARGASELGQLLGAGSLLDKVLKDGGEIAKLVAATGQNQSAADRAVAALRKLLDYVQAKTADQERTRIRSAQVSTEAIQGWPESVVQQYNASHKPGIAILEKLKLLLPTGTGLSGAGEKRGTFGIGYLDDKRWYLGQEPGSWTGIGKQYAENLLKGEQEVIVAWLAEISSPVELFSVVAHESHVEESKGVLVVNSSVYFLPPSLEASVKISESVNPDRGDPDALFDISGRRIPMYQFFSQEMEPCLLFINSSNSAHAIHVPWKAEDGWTLSKTGEVKARLRVPSQDAGAMDELLEQHAAWLEEKAHTDKEKRAYLSGLVWPEVHLQLALDAGATPSVFRLDLPRDEPEAPPQTKGTSDGNASE